MAGGEFQTGDMGTLPNRASFTDCFSLFPSQTMVHVTNSGTMLVDDLKLFLYGLPPDCQESTLTDFLEGTRTHQLLNCWEPLFP